MWCSWWWCVLVAATVHGARDKREESESHIVSPMPFVMGSRYGRSPGRLMAPRNDRFFMGSRYGKRAEVVPADGTAQWEAAGAGEGRGAAGGGLGGSGPLYCRYTGVSALYRCRAAPHLYTRNAEPTSHTD